MLQRGWNQTFSGNKHGYDPRHFADQTLPQVQVFLRSGNELIVDIIMSAFLARGNHDCLMFRLETDIQNKQLLKLNRRRYLQAGSLAKGLIIDAAQGAPRGFPLSLFVSKLILDKLVKGMEVRGISFGRYHDCNIYVENHRTSERAMASATCFITRQKNEVAVPSNGQLTGYRLTAGKHDLLRKTAAESLLRSKAKVLQLTNRKWGSRMGKKTDRFSKYFRGWRSCSDFVEITTVLRDLDSRLRCGHGCLRSQWKTYYLRNAELVSGQFELLTAWRSKGAWRMSHLTALQIRFSAPCFYNDELPGLYA